MNNKQQTINNKQKAVSGGERKKLSGFKKSGDRRKYLEDRLNISLKNIGSTTMKEEETQRNIENMIGASQIPLGVAGPLRLIHLTPSSKEQKRQALKKYYLPLATTEGALVASVNRGCKAIAKAGNATVYAQRIGATRGPVFYVDSLKENKRLYQWVVDNEDKLKQVAASTAKHLRYKKAMIRGAGNYVFIRFYFDTQDAMGMNMVTIATQKMIHLIEQETKIRALSVAGNFDIDKKPAWMNFINNRGFKAWAEVILPEKGVQEVLKVEPQALFDTWLAKCMVGSAMSGSLGFNAHYANIVAALFIATGQDPAHVVEGSMGLTTTKVLPNNDLYFSVYLPALMVGTVGGGTVLPTQSESLELLGVSGGGQGENAQRMAEIVAGAVLAGELSLIASETEGSLSRAHENLGR